MRLVATLVLCLLSLAAWAAPAEFGKGISTTIVELNGAGAVVSASKPGQAVSATYGYFKYVSGTLSGPGTGVTGVNASTAQAVSWSGVQGIPGLVAAVSNNTYTPSWTAIGGVAPGVANISNSSGFVSVTGVTASGLVSAPYLLASKSVSFTGGSYINDNGGTFLLQSQFNRYDNPNGGDMYEGNPAARMILLNGGTDCAGAAGVICAAGILSATDIRITGLLRVTSGTGTISATNGYFNKVSATTFVGDGSGLFNLPSGGTPQSIVSNTTRVDARADGTISLTTGGVVTGYFDNLGRLVAPGVSATGTVSAASFYGSGTGLTNLSVYESVSLSIAARADNFTVTGMTSTSQVVTQVRLTPTSSSIIAGINANGVSDGKTIRLTNVTNPTSSGSRAILIERSSAIPTSGNSIYYSPMAVPIILLSGETVTLQYSTADSRWNVVGGNRIGSPSEIFDEWNDMGLSGVLCTGSGTGATCGVSSVLGSNTSARVIGATFVSTGSTAAGREYLGFQNGEFFLGSGAALYVSRPWVEQLATGAQNFKTFSGLGDASSNAGTPQNFVGYSYDVSSSTSWRIAAFSGGSSTSSTVSGLTVSTTQPLTFIVYVNGDGSNVDYFHAVSSTLVYDGSINSNIPTGSSHLVSVQSGITKNTGTSAVFFDDDFIGLTCQCARGQ